MPAARWLVRSPILPPIAARPGDVLAWFPARGISVVRRQGRGWTSVRALPFANAGALAGLLAEETVTPYDAASERLLASQLAAALLRPRAGSQATRQA